MQCQLLEENCGELEDEIECISYKIDNNICFYKINNCKYINVKTICYVLKQVYLSNFIFQYLMKNNKYIERYVNNEKNKIILFKESDIKEVYEILNINNYNFEHLLTLIDTFDNKIENLKCIKDNKIINIENILKSIKSNI